MNANTKIFRGHVGIGPAVSGIALVAARGMAPRALILNHGNPIMAQGAAFADLAFIDRFAEDITRAVRTGDHVEVDPAKGTVTVRAARA